VKKRSQTRRQRGWTAGRRPLGIFSRRKRDRKPFTFERLEDRFVFSVSPLDIQTVSFSNSTPEGAAAIWLRELEWAAREAASATNPALPRNVFNSLPTDPMFDNQWHLLNTGQEVGNPDLQALFGAAGEDINVVGAWNLGYTGDGVLVGVFDSGVQLFHPDLVANIHPTLRLNATTGTTNASPSLLDPAGFHGTAVAGVIGAVANNGIGGSGVAPGVTIVPIRRDFTSLFEEELAFQWAIQNGIDITNNSWGPDHSFDRGAIGLTPEQLEILRNSVVFGRDGLGMIHVFSSGNDGGPSFSQGFGTIGNYDSSSYRPYANSRYAITVTGVDHDGLYVNADGTFTTYPTAGPNVLVAAPTGSNGAITVAEDDGYGSGIWTTDLVGDFGFNAVPLPGGFDPDQDPWPDPNYTSRFNGTSAAAPMVTGVIALMLEANPNLTYRDIQEILVRSSRQNAQFEFPSSGGLGGALASQNTWQTNQIGPFRNPDVWFRNSGQDRFLSIFDPLADPNNEGIFFGGLQTFAPDGGDLGRQLLSHYEVQPALFTNGAGYTVSQGYGVYAEQIGYGHGVVDAELAVRMAEQWHTLGQNSNRLTEKTFTTSILNPGPGTVWTFPAAEKMNEPPSGPAMIVPGGFGGDNGFIAYWNQYYVDDDPMNPDDGPFADYDGPHASDRGLSYVDFSVPPNEAINVEWVEVKIELTGPAADLDFIRMMLTSPDGTQSELNHYYADPDLLPSVFSFQDASQPAGAIDPAGDIDVDGGSFTWTFSTNRNWGESTNTSVIIDPVTGEPLLQKDPFTGIPFSPIFRDWELHLENWSNSDFGIAGIEVVWHGKPISGGGLDQNWNVAKAQRVQGFVGIDTNTDNRFNFQRSNQAVFDFDGDPDTIRSLDVERQLDFTDTNFNGVYDPAFDIINQEPFAENILVEAYRVIGETVESTPTARFLTGADGNYYFDLDPSYEYEIRITDPLGRIKLEDIDTPASAPPGSDYLQHYRTSWRITPDWFYAPDRDNPIAPGDMPGEVFYGLSDANGDGIFTEAPLPFMDLFAPVPMAVKNINFLLKQDAPANEFVVNGTVYADVNGNGIFDGDDATAAGVFVYWDKNRNGTSDAGETRVMTDASGQYSLLVDLSTLPGAPAGKATYQIGVIPPTNEWIPTDPGGDAVETVFAGPGSPPQVVNFFLNPPDDSGGGNGQLGSILGVVFSDLDKDGTRDVGEAGLSGVRVFIDADESGTWDSASEVSTITASNGSYFFGDVEAGLVRIDVHIPNEGTAAAAWAVTFPALGYQEVSLGAGGTASGVNFGLENRADRDWGDLPNSYSTTRGASPVGPSHQVLQGVRLGSKIDGEVDGIPSPTATGDDSVGDNDDGVRVVSNGGILQPGVNLLQVTVLGFGSVLTGWIDWNKNGHFDPAEKLTWRDSSGSVLGDEAQIVQGTYTLQVIAPDDMAEGFLAARFRWGEPGLDYFGPAIVGEVEDYFFTALTAPLSGLSGDYNNDGVVDARDYITWRRYVNTNTYLPNDETPGSVTSADYDVWEQNFGMVAAVGAGALGNEPAAASAEAEPAPAAVVAESLQPEVLIVAAPAGQQSLSADSPAVVVAASPAAIVDAPAEAVAETSASASPLAFDVTVGESTTTLSTGVRSRVAITGIAAVDADAQADLLLLDEALADLDMAEDDDPVVDRFRQEDESIGDLELAAVFADESTSWWSV
jgi:hypothetical protein